MKPENLKTINVANSLVQGKILEVDGKQVVSFLSIPYCKPPINNLRFMRPQPFEFPSNEIINKLHFETCPPQLFQRIFNGENEDEETWIPKEVQSEDCLYLNIWCPLNILDGEVKSPVLIWIYGGGFVSGSSSLEIYNGSLFAAQQNVIVVSFNYRVAMLGFICLDDMEINGNLGLWDQLLALKWIYQNISAFNGNRDNMTITGNSAGGCSVSLHLLIEDSWQYFHKAIMLSGVCFSDWGFLPKTELIRRSVLSVNKILDKFKYPVKWEQNLARGDKENIIRFLQEIDFREFLIDSEIVEGIVQFAWAPCCDGELIKMDPRCLVEEGKFKKCPTIFLSVKNEGTYFILSRFHDITMNANGLIDFEYFDESLKYFPHYPVLLDHKMIEEVKREYRVEDKPSIHVLDKIVSDQYFVCGSIELATAISRFNKEVYYLWFRTASENISWPKWCGCMHSDEVYYLFGYSMMDSTSEACKVLMDNFSNFMEHGKSKQRRHIHHNIQTGARLLASPSIKSYRRPISMNMSRYRRLSAQQEEQEEGSDNCSPTRAYHSDSETVVRKEKEPSFRNQRNSQLETDETGPGSNLSSSSPPPLPSSSSQFRVGDTRSRGSDNVNATTPGSIVTRVTCTSPGSHSSGLEVAMKRFSLRESSTSIFGCHDNRDESISTSAATKSGVHFERSPSLQHIGYWCSLGSAPGPGPGPVGAAGGSTISPCFRTPVANVSTTTSCHETTSVLSRQQPPPPLPLSQQQPSMIGHNGNSLSMATVSSQVGGTTVSMVGACYSQLHGNNTGNGIGHCGIAGYSSSDDFHLLSMHHHNEGSDDHNQHHRATATVVGLTGRRFVNDSTIVGKRANGHGNVHGTPPPLSTSPAGSNFGFSSWFNLYGNRSMAMDLLPGQQNFISNSGDNENVNSNGNGCGNSGMEDLSACMDLMIHIPRTSHQ